MLINNIAQKAGNKFFGDSEKLPLDVCIYGLELIISSIIGAIIVLIASAILGDVWAGVIYLIALSSIRTFSGGYHAKTYLRCNIVLIITFALSYLAYNYIVDNIRSAVNMMIIVCLALTVMVLLFMAPIENDNKMIMDRHKCKIFALCACISESLILFLLYNYLSFTPVIIIIPTQVVIVISIVLEYIIQEVEAKSKGGVHQ